MLFTYFGIYNGLPAHIVAKSLDDAKKYMAEPVELDACPLDITMMYASPFIYQYENSLKTIH